MNFMQPKNRPRLRRLTPHISLEVKLRGLINRLTFNDDYEKQARKLAKKLDAGPYYPTLSDYADPQMWAAKRALRAQMISRHRAF